MKHRLPELPFAQNALEPYMSAETIAYHYGKHHRGYVEKLNTLVQGTIFERMSLDEVMLRSSGEIFNNAAQAWNHEFFWNCLRPRSREKIPAVLMEAIRRDCGSLETLQNVFVRAAVAQFGSGYAWLVQNRDGSLAVTTTSNADNPLRHGQLPLFTCDVWEHAYYLDHRNDRAQFVRTIWNITNWDFIASNLSLERGVEAA